LVSFGVPDEEGHHRNVMIPKGFEMGQNPEEDRGCFHVTERGIVVIPKEERINS